MPFDLPLLQALRQAGWKVKIHDIERLEPPHVTIYQKMEKWRLSLRNKTFLDKDARWSQIEGSVRTAIEDNWGRLIDQWNKIHPDNPVHDGDDE